VHKRRPQSGLKGFVWCGPFSEKGRGGVLQMWTPVLFGAKTIGFFEIYSVSTRTRGRGGGLVWASADIFWTREEGSIFRDFVRTSFMDGNSYWVQTVYSV